MKKEEGKQMTSKSIKALEELKDELIPDYALEYDEDEGYKNWIVELYNTIKQDLERLEVLENNSNKVIKDSVALMNKNLELQQENEKLKKAFKLVTDIYLMNYWDIAKKLNNNIINKQEYELLKEVLSNE